MSRLLIYVLATIIIEGSLIILLYSYGYPSHISGSSEGLILIIALNFMLWILWGNAMGGQGAASPQGSWIYNPFYQLTVGIVGMFIIIAVIGEATNWLIEEIRKQKLA